MNFKYIIGIDSGIKGGICILDIEKNIVFKDKLHFNESTLDFIWFDSILKKYSNSFIVIEKVHSLPFFSGKSNFTFGGQYFSLISIIELNNIKYLEVISRKWQKIIFGNFIDFKVYDENNNHLTKETAAKIAVNLYKDTTFKLPRMRKNHDGIIDSLLIALYYFYK